MSDQPYRIYLAGPMRGFPQYNFPAFFDAEREYEAAGCPTVNPARVDVEADGFDPRGDSSKTPPHAIEHYMARARRTVAACRSIALLPGWEDSEGVRIELDTAAENGLRAWEHAEWLSAGRPDPANWIGLHAYPAAMFLTLHTKGESRASLPPVLPAHAAPTPSPVGEVRVVDPATGGEKCQKLARFDLLPPDVIWEDAEHYGKCGGNGQGPGKYADRNWERGYAYSLSIAAAHRHLNAIERGEDIDPETGTAHAICVRWHMATVRAFQLRGIGTDDRVFRNGQFQPQAVQPKEAKT